MNDNEKSFEALRIYPMAYDVYKKYYFIIVKKFMKGTRFPYHNRVEFHDDRRNKWTLVLECRSKEQARKGIVRPYCYTVYNVEKNKKDGNGGKGIVLFDPVVVYEYLEKKSERYPAVMDFVPHCFNRYTERRLKPLGKENMEFDRKVEWMMCEWQYFDVMGDKSSDKHTDKGFVPYDVFMSGGGILRGQFATNALIRFFTYVSKDMLFDEQREWYDEQMKELWNLRRKGKFI